MFPDRRRERGVTAIEYGILAALIAVVIITVVGYTGGALSNTFNRISHITAGLIPDANGCADGAYVGDYSEYRWWKTSYFTDGEMTEGLDGTKVWVGYSATNNGHIIGFTTPDEEIFVTWIVNTTKHTPMFTAWWGQPDWTDLGLPVGSTLLRGYTSHSGAADAVVWSNPCTGINEHL